MASALRRPTLFLADSQSLFCELVARTLERRFEIVGFAVDGPCAASEAARLKPDIVMLDTVLPLLNGLDAAARIRASSPATRIAFLSARFDSGILRKALALGALGFLLKSSAAEELSVAAWRLVRGLRYVTPALAELVDEASCAEQASSIMTPREREVVQLLAEGNGMKQAADVLNVSTRTIAFHKYRVMRRLGVNSSAELVRIAVSEGLVVAQP